MTVVRNLPKYKRRRQALRNDPPEPERRLWQYLRGKQTQGHKFRRQHGVGPYILDFYCPQLQLAIELDGDSHYQGAGMVHDAVRDRYLRSQNITVLRYTNRNVMENLEGVYADILRHLP